MNLREFKAHIDKLVDEGHGDKPVCQLRPNLTAETVEMRSPPAILEEHYQPASGTTTTPYECGEVVFIQR